MNYVFADFELDADRAELRRGGQPLRIEPQVFDLLKLLVSARDRVVSRDEIFEEIWGNRIVSDAALSSRIRDARKALGDDGTTQRFIRTVQRRGLRFVGDAREVASAGAVQPARPPAAREADIFARPALAVLPFQNVSLGAETGTDGLSDAITDELAAALAAWRYFPVIARNSTARFRDSDQSVKDIGAALNARYLVTGVFRAGAGRLKIQVAVSDTESDCQTWADKFVCNADELVDLEEEIAARIAGAIMPELESAETRRLMRKAPADMDAWELAMRAAWLINRRTRAELIEAEGLAMQAAELAPDWVLPYTLIASSRFQQAMTGFSAADSSKAFQPALDAARRALDIDHSAWMAHALSGVGELWTNQNHDKALLHVEKAIALNPSAAINYHFGGCITGFSGNTEGARAHQERLFRVDPLYPHRAVIEADLGLWHLLEADYDAADERLARSHAWDPTYGRALQRRIALSGLTGDRNRAREAAGQLAELGLPLDLDVIAASYPFRDPNHRATFLKGLREAGVNL